MRKRSVNHIADTIFWYAVYMLPLILTVIQSIGIFGNFTFDNWEYINANTSASDYDFLFLLDQNLNALGCANGGLIYDVFSGIFGDSGIMPIIFRPAIFSFAQWFVVTMFIHLCVDFVLFIPRIAHKWLDDFAKKESK